MSIEKLPLLELREIVATLYNDKSSIRRILGDAGLDTTRFNFDDRTINVWHEVLAEVEKQGQLSNLIQTIQLEYPKNTELSQSWYNYLDTINRKGVSKPLDFCDKKSSVKIKGKERKPKSRPTSCPAKSKHGCEVKPSSFAKSVLNRLHSVVRGQSSEPERPKVHQRLLYTADRWIQTGL